MAVYFDYPIRPLHDDNERKNTVLAWHKISPLLAIGATSGGKGAVQFYLDEVYMFYTCFIAKMFRKQKKT